MTAVFVHAKPVTLNLFQGPSLNLRRSVQNMSGGAVARFKQASARAARWILKQVQDDELGGGKRK